MAITDVKKAFQQVTADRKFSVEDVDTVLKSTGGSISADEEKELKADADAFAGMMDPAAKAKLSSAIDEIANARAYNAAANRRVQVAQTKLTKEVHALLAPGVTTKSYGGTVIPEAVKASVSQQLAGGATAYDVRELKADPIYDVSHEEHAVASDGKFNPYSQQSRASDTLAFSHTELTPEKIAADMNTVQTFNVQAGYTDNNSVATFEKKTMKGNGNITDLYDEATWPDTMARAPGGQKYASNFAILADGSVHAVPASRRTSSAPNLILTTASLGRGKQMLLNGHIQMQGGVITKVGMSGRLCKLEAGGQAKFVDPLPILKAWGFKLAPGLTVTREG